LEHLIEKRKGSNPTSPLKAVGVPWHIRLREKVRNIQKARSRKKGGSRTPSTVASEGGDSIPDSGLQRNRRPRTPKLRADMIRRIADDKPQLINPMGWISEREVQTVDRDNTDDKSEFQEEFQDPQLASDRPESSSKTSEENPQKIAPNDKSIQ
jgi:hypothetical protein